MDLPLTVYTLLIGLITVKICLINKTKSPFISCIGLYTNLVPFSI